MDFIASDPAFQRAWSRLSELLVVRQLFTESQQMQPVAAAAEWNVPHIGSAGELADWFWLEYGQLEWLADLAGLGSKTRNARLSHYHYRVLAKQGAGARLIEEPKPRLKDMQRQVLEEIIDRVPAHPAAHGFVHGRSILTFAAPHTGRGVVVRMDLHDFFPSIGMARVQAVFRTAGYPESVADLLGGICTNKTPREVLKRVGNDQYSRRHLPQGAPTSPALANLCAYRMDCRLSGLAKTAGAEYTRYADDLAFSGGLNFERGAERFSMHVAAIVAEEGFAIHHRKTRIMRQGVRQHLAGLVVNRHVNVRRSDFDELKAILANCIRWGPAEQNRDGHDSFHAHLRGRIGFVEMVNPGKGARLRALFERIEWALL